jgi:DNA-binding NarL/FixJ family response regulator
MIQLLIISDVRLYREGLEKILRDDERIRVVEAVRDVEEAAVKTQRTIPDVVLFDMAAANAMVGLRQLAHQFVNSKIVALAVSEKYEAVIGCAEAGVSGYIFRNDSVDDLVKTLERVIQNELPCPHHISAMLLERIRRLDPTRGTNIDDIHLTRRELEILRLIGEGLSNKEIASRLVIEISTVKNHVHNLLEKLHVRSRVEVIAKLPTILHPNSAPRS